MYIYVGPTGPITCSQCGSTNAVNPVNESDVIIRCLACGHEKRKPEERKSEYTSWTTSASDKKYENTF